MSESHNPMPLGSWEDLAASRERLARIETKVDMLLSTFTVHSETMRSLEVRQEALEQGRIANRADIAAMQQQIKEWRVEREQFGYNLTQFLAWMEKVNHVVDQFNSGVMVAMTSSTVRKQDIAILSGGVMMAVSIIGLAIKVFM